MSGSEAEMFTLKTHQHTGTCSKGDDVESNAMECEIYESTKLMVLNLHCN